MTTSTGRRHPDYDRKPLLLGRGIDLSKAYKQVSVAPQSARHSVLGVRSESGEWKFFISKSLLLEPRPAFCIQQDHARYLDFDVRKFHLLPLYFMMISCY